MGEIGLGLPQIRKTGEKERAGKKPFFLRAVPYRRPKGKIAKEEMRGVQRVEKRFAYLWGLKDRVYFSF